MTSTVRKFQLIGTLTALTMPASSVFLTIGEDPAYAGGPLFAWFLVDDTDFVSSYFNIRISYDDQPVWSPHKYLGSCVTLGRMVHAFHVP